MAPRKMIKNNIKEVFLYMMEIFIDQLSLKSSVVDRFFAESIDFSIHIHFLNYPELIMNSNEFAKQLVDSEDLTKIFKFDAGTSCIFLKNPQEFSKDIKNASLNLELRKQVIDKICSDSEENDFFGNIDINLSKCLCQTFSDNLVEVNKNPISYEQRNIHELLDKDKLVVGNVDVFLRFTCFGNCLTTQFYNSPDKKFVFKNLNSTTEFECLRLLTEKQKKRPNNNTKFDNGALKNGPKPGTILGISAIVENYFNKCEHHSLNPVQGASGINMEHELNEMEKNSRDDKMKNYTGNELGENDLRTETKTYSMNEKNNEEGLENFEQNLVHQRLTNSEEKINGDLRIRGGGVDDFLKNQERFADPSIEALQTDHYETNSEIKLGCGCLLKSNLNAMKSESKCIKSPCKGISCLIRAFKETQEFVDSIGKVPGMKGLGLMDPAESPYFNRTHWDLATTRMPKSPINSLLTDGQKQSYPFSDTLKNLEEYKKITDGRNYEFDGISDRKSAMFRVTKGNEDGKIKRQGNELDVLKKKRSRKKGFSHGNDQNGFNPPSVSEPRVFKKSKMKKSKLNYSKKHTQKIASRGIQSISLPSNNIKVSKRIMKLVEAAQTRFYFGHRSCIDIRVRVPGNMGWLWNTRNTPGKLKPQIGWKPGAISRHVWNLLEDAKVERTSEEIRNRPLTPVRSKKVKGSKRKHLFFPARNYRLKDGESQLPPTLHIHRKNGDYYVTFYPIDRDLINDPEKQESIKPLYFQIKRDRTLHENNNSFGDSSSTASDMEIEFSPPAATSKYRKKIDICDFNTEVHQEDIDVAIKELYPPEVKPKPAKRKVKKLKKLKKLKK